MSLETDDDATVLRPSLTAPAGLAFMAVFVLFLAYVTFAAAGPEAWGLYVPLVLFAAPFAWAALSVFRRRHRLALEITPYALTLGQSAFTRKAVVGVRRHSELHFKGVRVDLDDGRWVGIPHHLHHPRRVLAALRRYGYPVEG